MKNWGITVIELVVVISIIGILFVSLGFSYQDWIGRYKVESATKGLYSDLMNARMRALERGMEHYVIFGERSYLVAEDTNESGDYDAGDRGLPGFPKTVGFSLDRNVSGKITFNNRGLISGLQRIWVSSDTNPDYDCMKVSRARIIMGQYNDGECLPK